LSSEERSSANIRRKLRMIYGGRLKLRDSGELGIAAEGDTVRGRLVRYTLGRKLWAGSGAEPQGGNVKC